MKRLLLAGLAIAGGTYLASRLLRPWCACWGSLQREREAELPGDELSPDAGSVVTRAVTINAPSATVWQWLVQIGQERAGFYSYRWLENLALADMPCVETIVPRWQKREVGDIVWLATPRHYKGHGRQIVAAVEPGSHLIMVGDDDWDRLRRGSTAEGTWGFVIQPIGPDACRLIARSRYRKSSALFDLAHFIMERRMLLGIKRLAERSCRPEPVASVSA
jgi:hypothetical protein